MSDNPFQPQPQGNSFTTQQPIGPVEGMERIVQALRQTRPWVRFISVLMFIGSAFIILAAVFMVLGSMVGGISSLGGGIVAAIIYLVMAAIYVAPAVFLWQFANRIAELETRQDVESVGCALEAQKSFWKFVGIAAAIIMVIYAVILIGVVVVGLAAFTF